MMNATFDRQPSLAHDAPRAPGNSQLARAMLCAASMLAAVYVPPSALAATGIKAAYVEPVLPSKPFSGFLPSGNLAAGPSTGVLGITSLTAYNGNNVRVTAYIFVTEVVGPTCNSLAVSSAGKRLLTFIDLPAHSQVHLTSPSPLVVEPISGAANGLTCVSRTASSSLEVMVNGFSN